MRSAIRFERMRPAVTSDLSGVITHLLAGDTDLRLRVEAADAVGDGHFETHAAYLVALLDGAQPWPVRRAAWRSLAALNQVLGPGQRAAFVMACAERLPDCEAELRGAIETSIVDELQDERWEHVQLLSSVGRLDLVLPTRFAFGVADDLYWSVRPLAGDSVDDVPDPARAAWRVLHQDHTPEDLLELFESGPELVALAAAHRLLAERSEHVASLIDHVTAESPPSRLLAVAATLGSLDDDRLDRVRSLVAELIERMDPELLEPIAALVSGLPDDDLTGKQLFFRAMTRYRDLFPDLVNGPLETAWFRSPPWDSSDYGSTLLAGGDQTYLALLRLAWSTFPLDARQLRTLELGEDALAVIDGYQPVTATDRVVHIRACAAAGLLTGLEHAYNAARDPEIAEVTHTYRHRRHGQSQVSALGEVLTCIGYLGRTAADLGHPAGREAHAFLAGFNTTGHHSTVERGRLLGLAILGDWVSILSALIPGDQHLHRAARNAVEIWAPGPETPNWGVEPDVVARWIGTRLAADQRLLAPAVRSILSEIKAQIERSLGRIVPPD